MESNPEMSGDADFRNPGSQESGFFYAQKLRTRMESNPELSGDADFRIHAQLNCLFFGLFFRSNNCSILLDC